MIDLIKEGVASVFVEVTVERAQDMCSGSPWLFLAPRFFRGDCDSIIITT
jgi:hypothetical protein